MKVICIDKDAWPHDYTPAQSDDVKIENGESYTVVQTINIGKYTWYELFNDLGWLYWEGCFICTSTIDETEMKREYNHEPA